jgi:hypothetical protein
MEQGESAAAVRHGRGRRRLGAALLASSSMLAILATAPVAQAQAITVPPNVQTIVIAPGSTKTSISIANNGTVGTPTSGALSAGTVINLGSATSVNAFGLNVGIQGGFQVQGDSEINVPAGTLTGAISNAGLVQIAAAGTVSSTTANSLATGLLVRLNPAIAGGQGMSVGGALLTGPIVNSGTIAITDATRLSAVGGASLGDTNAQARSVGIQVFLDGGDAGAGARAAGSTLAGTLVNSDLISLGMTGSATATSPAANSTPLANVSATGISVGVGAGFANGGQFAVGAVLAGTVLNSGTIAVAVTPSAVTTSAGGGAHVSGIGIVANAQSSSSAAAGSMLGTIAGSISNTGRIVVTVAGTGAADVRAIGILGVAGLGTAAATNVPAQFAASIGNAGVISVAASGTAPFADGTVLNASAQVLAQSLRFGLERDQIVVDTIENRILVGRSEQGPGLALASLHGDRLAVSDADQQAQVPVGGTGLGAAAWGRAYGTEATRVRPARCRASASTASACSRAWIGASTNSSWAAPSTTPTPRRRSTTAPTPSSTTMRGWSTAAGAAARLT